MQSAKCNVQNAKIGFYICHCGINISYKVRVEEVAAFARSIRNVVVARDYKFMCSDPGQAMIEKDIREMGLDRVVVASCSPRLHGKTFMGACNRAGLNPYFFQMASVREQVSWVTLDEDDATDKAKSLVAAAINRVAYHHRLEARQAAVHPDILVVGGGIAGMQAAIDIANSGHTVYLVERNTTIGGHMLQFDKTFPTLDCAACIGTPKMVEVAQNKNIRLLSFSEVKEVSGFIGNYTVKIHRKPRYVREGICTGCGECAKVCPVSVPNSWDEGLSDRKAIGRSFPQAIPVTFNIEKKDRAPCVIICPAGVNVQGYVQLIAQGKYKEAVSLIMQRLPFPGTLGRVCSHPCESRCRRAEYDTPIAIRELKRFASDQVSLSELPCPEIKERPEKIAIIGSGPAGLTAAYYLRLKGFQVTVFEPQQILGGILRSERVPPHIPEQEIAHILSLGISTRIGTDITLADLDNQGFAAVFLSMADKKSFNPHTMQTSVPHVFAGRDAASAAAIIKAVATGHKAVSAIEKFLNKEDSELYAEEPQPKGGDWRQVTEKIQTRERFLSSDEKLSEEDAKKEAMRCLNCGVCCECMECVKVCEAKAIDHTMKEEELTVKVGSILLATGYDIMDPTPVRQYGYRRYPNVYTALEFERLSNATGPTGGKILIRDKNGHFTEKPQSVAIIHCIGSRDVNYHEYCSRVCCMYALKYTHLIKEKVGHDTKVYDFYIDMRCFGKGYEEFYRRCQEEGTIFIRGKVAELTDQADSPEEKGKIVAIAEDTLLGMRLRVPVDMAILCTAIEARKDAPRVGRIFGVNIGSDGFFLEEHPKLGPLSTATDGVFLCGCCQKPMDIPDAVSQASGAAAKALALATLGKVEISPTISWIDPDICIGCQMCIGLCPYGAIEFDERRSVSVVNEAVCKGCGSCSGFCPSGAAGIRHFGKKQLFAEIDGMMDTVQSDQCEV